MKRQGTREVVSDLPYAFTLLYTPLPSLLSRPLSCEGHNISHFVFAPSFLFPYVLYFFFRSREQTRLCCLREMGATGQPLQIAHIQGVRLAVFGVYVSSSPYVTTVFGLSSHSNTCLDCFLFEFIWFLHSTQLSRQVGQTLLGRWSFPLFLPGYFGLHNHLIWTEFPIMPLN